MNTISSIKHYFGQFDPLDKGSYDWNCARYTSQLPIQRTIPSLVELIGRGDKISSVLKKIKNILDYIILLREIYMGLRAESLLASLPVILSMPIDNIDKAQLIRNQWLGWASWMQAIHPGPDLLREECCVLAVELMLILSTAS